jgi:hypothetical protein
VRVLVKCFGRHARVEHCKERGKTRGI